MDIAESSEGLEFELKEDGETYTVTGIGICTDTDIVICLYNGAPITSIGDGAFEGCTNLTSVTIGNGVTSIGRRAFSDCTILTIYCEAEAQPSGWDSNWNSDNRPVVWRYVADDTVSADNDGLLD